MSRLLVVTESHLRKLKVSGLDAAIRLPPRLMRGSAASSMRGRLAVCTATAAPRCSHLARQPGSLFLSPSRSFTTAASSLGFAPPNTFNQQRPHLLLVDGVELLHRLQYGKPENDAPQPTTLQLVRTFMHLWVDALTKHSPPTHAIVAMDYPLGVTFRHQLLPSYTVSHSRSPNPSELWQAVFLVHRLLRALKVPVVRSPGVEADDVIATFTTRARTDDMEVSIMSPDTGFFQLLQPHVKLLRAAAGMHPHEHASSMPIYDANDLQMEYQFPVQSWLDFLVVYGDNSVDLPGLPNVGPKGARQMIQQYGTIEGILENADKMKKSVCDELRKPETGPALRFSRSLQTLRTDLHLPCCRLPWSSCVVQRPDTHSRDLHQVFAACGLHSGHNNVWDRLQEMHAWQRMQQSQAGIQAGKAVSSYQ